MAHPAERMKMREQHLVPLSRQAVAILRELHAITGPVGYLFPSVRSKRKPISENTLKCGPAQRGLCERSDDGSRLPPYRVHAAA